MTRSRLYLPVCVCTCHHRRRIKSGATSPFQPLRPSSECSQINHEPLGPDGNPSARSPSENDSEIIKLFITVYFTRQKTFLHKISLQILIRSYYIFKWMMVLVFLAIRKDKNVVEFEMNVKNQGYCCIVLESFRRGFLAFCVACAIPIVTFCCACCPLLNSSKLLRAWYNGLIHT